MRESTTTFVSKTFTRAYLIGMVILWVSIVIGTTIMLLGTPYYVPMLLILFAGMIWSLVLLPGAYFWTHLTPGPSMSNEGLHEGTARRATKP